MDYYSSGTVTEVLQWRTSFNIRSMDEEPPLWAIKLL